MLSVLLVVCAAAALAWVEMPRLLKRGWIREASVFAVSLLIGVAMATLTLLHVTIPTPIYWLRMMFTPVSDGINSLLGLK